MLSPSGPDRFSGNKASASNFSKGQRYDSQSPDKGRNSFYVSREQRRRVGIHEFFIAVVDIS